MIRDLLSRADLATWAVVALLLFVAVFVLVVVRTFSPARNAHYRQMSELVLDDKHDDKEVCDGQAN